MCLYNSVCVGPVRKPHCWFSHEAAFTAHLSLINHVNTHYRLVRAILSIHFFVKNNRKLFIKVSNSLRKVKESLDMRFTSISSFRGTTAPKSPYPYSFIRRSTCNMSRAMRKTDFCLCENKGADQLRGNREADQPPCFRYMDSTIPLLLKSKISRF